MLLIASGRCACIWNFGPCRLCLLGRFFVSNGVICRLGCVVPSLVRKIVGSAFWRAMVRFNGARTFLASAMQVGYRHYGPTADELRDYVASYEGRVDQVVAYFASYPEGLTSIDPHLDALEVPVQVFWGDMDAFLSAANARLLHRRLPKSRLTIFEDCGHFCYQDKPEAFTQMLREWVHGGYEAS